jgi:hypothetical protein
MLLQIVLYDEKQANKNKASKEARHHTTFLFFAFRFAFITAAFLLR